MADTRPAERHGGRGCEPPRLVNTWGERLSPAAAQLVEGREPGRLVLPGGRHLGVRAVALPLQALPLAPEEIELIVEPPPGTDQALLEQARGQAQAEVAQVSDAVVRVTLRSDGAFEGGGARKMQEFVSYVAGRGLDDLG